MFGCHSDRMSEGKGGGGREAKPCAIIKNSRDHGGRCLYVSASQKKQMDDTASNEGREEGTRREGVIVLVPRE